jgi:hypothetical protein
MVPHQQALGSDQIDAMTQLLIDECIASDDPPAGLHAHVDALSTVLRWSNDGIGSLLNHALSLLKSRVECVG